MIRSSYDGPFDGPVMSTNGWVGTVGGTWTDGIAIGGVGIVCGIDYCPCTSYEGIL